MQFMLLGRMDLHQLCVFSANIYFVGNLLKVYDKVAILLPFESVNAWPNFASAEAIFRHVFKSGHLSVADLV